MNKTGLKRDGSLQMLVAVTLMLISAVGPFAIAVTRPSQQWLLSLSGLPALALSGAGVCVVLLYAVGFLRYCASKGYSKWLGLWLLLGNVFGFIVLLLLPERGPVHQEGRERKVPFEMLN